VQAGSLAITSQQDTSTFKSKQTNIGVSVSAEFGNSGSKGATNTAGDNGTGRAFNGAGASVSFGQTRQSGDFASVQEQSGIKAGSGGFDIRVAGATTLTGGVIASEAAPERNQLTTGTLSATDLQNREKFKASSINLSASISGIGRPNTTTPPAGTNTGTGTNSANTAQVPANGQGEPTQGGNRTGTTAGLRTGIGTIAAGAPSVASASGSQSSTTLSAIATGGITITSGDTASLGVAQTISRDTSAANEALTKEFTAAKREEIAQGFAAAQALTQQVSVFFNNRASEEADLRKNAEALAKKDANGTALRDPRTGAYIPADGLTAAQSRALVTLNTSIEGYRTFGAGGATRIALTALSGAAGSNVAGGLGSLAQSAAVNVLQSLAVTRVKELADSIQGDPATRESVRAALQAVVGCAGAAAGGSNGCGSAAAGAAASVVLNNLLSTGTTTGTDADGNPLTLEAQQARTNLIATIIAGIAGAVGADASAAVTGAIIETENNSVSIGCTASPTVTCLNDQQIISRNTDFAAVGAVNLAALQTCLNGPLGTSCDEGRDVVIDRLAQSNPNIRTELNGLSNEDLLARYNGYINTSVNDTLIAFLNPDLAARQAAANREWALGQCASAACVYPDGKLPQPPVVEPEFRPTPEQIRAARSAIQAGLNPAQLRDYVLFSGGFDTLTTSRRTPVAQQVSTFNETSRLLEGAGREALGNVNIERFQAYLRNPPTAPARTLAERTEREQFALAQSYLAYERRLNPGLSDAAFGQHVLSSGPSSLGGGALGAASTITAPATALTDSLVSVFCAFGCPLPPPPPPRIVDACSTFACLNGFQQGEAITGLALLLAPELRIGSLSPASATRLGISTASREGVSALNAEVRIGSAGNGIYVESRAVTDVFPELRGVNPHFVQGAPIGTNTNCVSCVNATLDRLRGVDPTATAAASRARVYSGSPNDINVLAFAEAETIAQAQSRIAGLSDNFGALLVSQPGTDVIHTINFIKRDGRIYLVDPQIGRIVTLRPGTIVRVGR
jgi:hypothetical protein